MIKLFYFLLLAAASAEDCKSHTVSKYVVFSIWLLGIINIVLEKENRWVTVSLTCICFALLCAVYFLVRQLGGKRDLKFGGADVRLIPAMMLVQGWDVALAGVFLGLLFAAGCYAFGRKRAREIPLVPWMSGGCLLIEIIYLFF